MKKVLLHIGTGKTGSSSIQKTLMQNRSELKSLNIGYPQFGHRTNHEELNIAIKGGKGPRAIRDRFKLENESDDDYRQRLLSELRQHIAENDNLIISAEHLYTIKQHHIDFLKELFEETGVTDVKIVLYVREPVSLYASQVQQKLRASSITVVPGKFNFDYCSLIKKWHDNFSDFSVREFDRQVLTDGDVLADFLHICSGFFSEPRVVDLNKSKATNESLALEEMVLLQRFRKMHFADKEDIFMPESGALMRHFRKVQGRLDLTRPTLKPEVIDIIRYNNTEAVEKLRSWLGNDFFPRFDPVYECPDDTFKHCESVLDLFEASSDINERVLDLAVNVLGKTLHH